MGRLVGEGDGRFVIQNMKAKENIELRYENIENTQLKPKLILQTELTLVGDAVGGNVGFGVGLGVGYSVGFLLGLAVGAGVKRALISISVGAGVGGIQIETNSLNLTHVSCW